MNLKELLKGTKRIASNFADNVSYSNGSVVKFSFTPKEENRARLFYEDLRNNGYGIEAEIEDESERWTISLFPENQRKKRKHFRDNLIKLLTSYIEKHGH